MNRCTARRIKISRITSSRVLRHIEPHGRNNLNTGERILWRIIFGHETITTLFLPYSNQATYEIMVNNSKLFDCICFRKARMDARRNVTEHHKCLYLSLMRAHVCVCVLAQEKNCVGKEIHTRVRSEEGRKEGRKKRKKVKRKKERKMKLFLKGCVGPRRCRWGPWFALRRLPGLAWILNTGKQLALPDAL